MFKEALARLSALGLPVLVALGLFAGGIVWTFAYHNQREIYFANLAHRTLAGTGQAMSESVAYYDTALANLLKAIAESKTEAFDQDVAGALNKVRGGRSPAEGTPLYLYPRINPERKPVEFVTTFDELADQPMAGFFDDLMVADKSGQVFYQKSHEGRRWDNVPFLLPRDETKKEGTGAEPPEAVGASALGKEFRVFQKMVHLEANDLRLTSASKFPGAPIHTLDLVLIGLIRNNRLESEELALPFTISLLFLFVGLGSLFFIPSVRVCMLKPLQRLKRRDGTWVAASVAITASLLTFAFLNLVFYRAGLSAVAWDRLADLSREIQSKVSDEIESNREILRAFTVSKCRESDLCPGGATGNLAEEFDGDRERLSRHLDQLTWVDSAGKQRTKFAMSAFKPPLVDVADREFYRAMVEGRGWRSAGQISQGKHVTPFYVQSLYSRTSGENTAVLSVPFNALVQGERYVDRLEVKGRKPLVVASVASRPASLFDTFLSPGYGFAIIGQDGKVLFHSDMARNLHENLYDELMDPAPLRSTVLAGGTAEFETAYNGKDYRFLAAPFAAFEGSGWTLVVFNSKDYFRAALSEITKISLSIYAVYAILISTVLGLLLWLTNKRTDPLAQGLNLLVWVWPNPRKYGNYSGFVVVFAVAILLYSAGMLAGPGLWLVFAAFVFPPAALVGGHALSRRWTERFQGAGHGGPWNVAYSFFAIAMVLFAMLVVVLPLTAFYQIAFDQDLREMQRNELLQLEEHLRERQDAAKTAAWRLQEKLDEGNRAELVNAQLREDFELGVYSGARMAPRPAICEPQGTDGVAAFTHWFSTLHGSISPWTAGSRPSAASRAQWCRPPANSNFSIMRTGVDFPFALATASRVDAPPGLGRRGVSGRPTAVVDRVDFPQQASVWSEIYLAIPCGVPE